MFSRLRQLRYLSKEMVLLDRQCKHYCAYVILFVAYGSSDLNLLLLVVFNKTFVIERQLRPL